MGILLPLKKAAQILQNHPVQPLGNHDTAAAPVVLVRNAVVQRLQHDAPVIFCNLDCDQLIVGQDTQLDIADFLIQACRRDQQRRTEMLVSAFGPFQSPSDLRRMRRKQVR